MPILRDYRIFISHAWKYSWEYYQLEKFLDTVSHFSWINLSVPEHDPILNPSEIKYELHNQMRPADVFIVLGGMYVAHSSWILYEIKFARRIGSPIIGVYPWGSTVMPVAVQESADDIVGWRRQSIVKAIRRLALPHYGR
jgi:hypothetical protein